MMSSPSATNDPDEISLLDLWAILVRRKLWILCALVVCTVAGVAYAFLSTPRYEVQVYVDKPTAGDIAALNLGRSAATGLAAFTPDQVFTYFSNRLLSDEAMQRFFRESFLPELNGGWRASPEQRLYEHMREKVIFVSRPDPKGRNLHRLRIEGPTGEVVARLAATYIDQVQEDAAKALVEDARHEVDVLVKNTVRDLDESRLTAAQQRKDRIVQLTEALKVAQAVGLRDPQVSAMRPPEKDLVTPFINGTELYARGSKSLSAELDLLKTRESDDPFISSLRDTESRLRLLQSLNIDPKSFRLFQRDGEIVAPTEPFKPKKGLVITLAVVLGLMGGVMLAFVAEFVASARAKKVAAA